MKSHNKIIEMAFVEVPAVCACACARLRSSVCLCMRLTPFVKLSHFLNSIELNEFCNCICSKTDHTNSKGDKIARFFFLLSRVLFHLCKESTTLISQQNNGTLHFIWFYFSSLCPSSLQHPNRIYSQNTDQSPCPSPWKEIPLHFSSVVALSCSCCCFFLFSNAFIFIFFLSSLLMQQNKMKMRK